jgi:hypothetical protein
VRQRDDQHARVHVADAAADAQAAGPQAQRADAHLLRPRWALQVESEGRQLAAAGLQAFLLVGVDLRGRGVECAFAR